MTYVSEYKNTKKLKNGYKKYSSLFFLLANIFIAGFSVVSTAEAAAGINEQINFQGKVVNTGGTNVATASYTFLFCIYTTASPTTACTSGADNDAVWRESKSITVTDGIFQTNLGDTTTLPGSVDFNTDNIYLGINFNANGQMTPLVRFTAAPYALNAAKVGGLTVTDTTGTLTIPNGKTISFADSFTTSGAFPLTLTSTASTTATLPSGTITLTDLTTGQTLTNKTIGSTGLTFSGATTDITTASGESLVIVAAGAGTVDIQDALTVDSLTADMGGITISAGALAVNSDSITSDGTLVINASGTVDVDDILNANSITSDAGISIAAGNSYTGAGAVILSSAATTALTVDSGTTGALNLGTGNNAKTISLGTGTAGNTINIGTDNTTSDTINIGSVLDNVAIIGDQWSVTNAGVLTVVSCSGCGGGGSTLDSAYTAGNTIGTDSGSNVIINLADVATPTEVTINNLDPAGTNALQIDNATTLTNGLFIEQSAAGTLGNAIQIAGTAGTIINGLLIADGAGTITNGIQLTGTFTTTLLDTPSLDITGAGAITGATGVSTTTLSSSSTTNLATAGASNVTIATTGTGTVAIGNSSGTFALTSSGGLNVTTGGALTGVASIDTIGVTATTLTFAGTGTVASTTTGLTLDSGSNTLTVAATDTALTASGIATMTLAANVTITNATGNIILQPAGSGTTANVQIGVGGGTGSATPDLLALDTKHLTGNPTGFVGAMYYNVADAKFKCFEGVAWKDCDTTSAGAGYGTIQEDGTGLTQRATVNFIGTGMTCIDNAGATKTDCTINSGGGGVSFASGTPDNTTGTNNLIQLQKNGLNKFVVANSGGLSIFGATANVTKTKTGTTNTEDFSLTGSTLTNVTSQNDEIDIDSGTVVTTFTSAAAATSAAVGAGGHSIVRDDGKILIIHGGVSLTGSLWNGSSATSSSVTIAVTNNVGAGAISLKRPDGKYLLVNGNASTATSVVDPWGITAATTTAAPANMCTAGAGTNAFMRPDGKYVILCGGSTAWSVYDPNANTYVAGSAVATGFGAGAHAIARDDGTFIVFAGGNTTTHYLYTPSGTTATAGTMSAANPITTNAPTINTGAFSIRRNDGKYLVVGGAINTSTIYNPTPTSSNSGAGSFELVNGGTPAAGFGPITTALGDAAQAVRRQDGKYLMVHGGASTLTDIIDLSKTDNTMFTAGTALNVVMGAGGHFVPRPDGKYAIVRGGGTNIDTYDMGFIIGGNGSSPQLASYETECITVASLNASSTLNWNTNAEGMMNFQVKTGTSSCSSSYRDVPITGGFIGGAAGDNRVQVKVFFKRPFFLGYDQEWGLWRGLSQSRYRAKVADPTLYDLTIDNSSQVHRTQFDFGIGIGTSATDPSGPVLSNINITTDKTAQLAMTSVGNQGLASTVTAIGATYNGAVGTHSVMATAATEGTVAVKRPNNTFMVIAGNSATSNAQIYDQGAQTFATNANGVSDAVCSGTGNGSCLPTTGAANTVTGRGALALKRPDGKFLVVLGGATTTTNIYDPVLSTFTLGPVTTAAVGRGALIIPLPNGRALIVHGNQLATTSVYDPVQNVMIAGPSSTAIVGSGSMAIPNANGTWLFVPGVASVGESATAYTCTTITQATNMFDPYAMAFTNTTGQPVMTTGIGPGAFAFQRSDGMWMISKGGNVVTTCAAASATAAFQLYNPVTMKMAVGPNSVVAPLAGGHAVQRPNGSWLIFNGGSTTTTQIYLENDGAASALAGGARLGSFTAGPATTIGIGSGAVSFQRDDGKYVMISGGTGTTALVVGTAATNVQQYDAGWIATGAYRTEQLNVSDLDTSSTLSWRASPDMKGISAEVRTATSQLGLQLATSRDVTSSGGLISPGGSETWLQIQFNFKRTFPSYSSIWSDTWWNGGSTNAHTWRNIGNPTLNEFKVNKDVNLVDLKSDGLSVFRVSTNGDIYTSNTGSVRTGGADLAENYTSATPLLPGEVVALDPLNNHGVKKATYQYQRDVLGVVSTAPGFVAGSYTSDSYPIALVGRVPVKVSNENGPIHAGDMLTAASIPGYAMRAVQAGRVIGTAMENLDEAKLSECPASEFIIAGRKCGEVMMFVNLVNYMGSPIDLVMAEKDASVNGTEGMTVAGVSSTDVTTGLTSTGNVRLAMHAPTRQEQVLSFLKTLRDERAQNSAAASEIFTDRISASTEIITPTLVVDQIFAKSIKADSIEGLQIFTDQLSSLQEKYAGLESATIASNVDGTNTRIGAEQKALAVAMKNLSADTITVQLDGSILGKLTVAGALRIGGDAEFAGSTLFAKLATFLSDVLFKGKVAFERVPTFGSDTAGFAVVAEGQQSVDVVFDEAYANQPIVSVSITSDQSSLAGDAAKDKQLAKDVAAVEADFNAAYFDGDIKYIVTKKSEQGFTIVLNKPVPRELQFSWVAIAVSDVKISHSKESAAPVAETAPAIVPLEIPIAAPATDVVKSDSSNISETEPIVGQDTPPAEAPPENSPSITDALGQLTNTLRQSTTP